MIVWALVSTEATCAVDLYVRRSDAYADLRDAVRDVPEWVELLSVAPIDLSEPATDRMS